MNRSQGRSLSARPALLPVHRMRAHSDSKSLVTTLQSPRVLSQLLSSQMGLPLVHMQVLALPAHPGAQAQRVPHPTEARKQGARKSNRHHRHSQLDVSPGRLCFAVTVPYRLACPRMSGSTFLITASRSPCSKLELLPPGSKTRFLLTPFGRDLFSKSLDLRFQTHHKACPTCSMRTY